MPKPKLPSPAMVVACLALFAAMGGTGYAAGSLASSSGRGPEAKAVAAKAKRGPRGKRGPAGPRGAVGPQGERGATGPAGPVELRYIEGATKTVAASGKETAQVFCPAGMHATGGGMLGEVSFGFNIASSAPSGTNAWIVDVENVTGSTQKFNAYVVCSTATSAS